MPEPAILALADGTCFVGESIGAAGSAVGEVVFNTAMTGYQEIATDPSYCRQIVTLTVPHIGNTGCTAEDEESTALHLSGLVIRDLPVRVSSWRSQGGLPEYLHRHGVVGIAGIDTRALTTHLRRMGAQPGCLLAGPQAAADGAREQAVAAAREFPGLSGMDLARVVSSREGYSWSEPPWQLEGTAAAPEPRFRVVAYDFGVKHNILRELVAVGCAVQVVPATTAAADVLALRPDGVFLSNGPGDPEPCDYAIEAIRQLLNAGVPLFGICLGHQLLGLAAGARTQKMKFGHHGANHPVLDIDTGQVLITSQNHGFAVDEASLPDGVRATHRSLFDGTLQGLELRDRPAFGFQGHPEASPGPHDVNPLFNRFAALMRERA